METDDDGEHGSSSILYRLRRVVLDLFSDARRQRSVDARCR